MGVAYVSLNIHPMVDTNSQMLSVNYMLQGKPITRFEPIILVDPQGEPIGRIKGW